MKTSPLDELVQPFGFPTYNHYLRSKLWTEFKDRYKNSELPQHCVGCGEGVIQLHHLTYERICQEELYDVIPLCGICHMAEHKIGGSFEKLKTRTKNKNPKKEKKIKESEIVPPEIRKFIEAGCGVDTLKKLFPYTSGKLIEIVFAYLYWLRPKPPEPIPVVKPKIDKSKVCKKCKEEKYPVRVCECVEKKAKNCIVCWAKLPFCLTFDKCKSCRVKEG